MNPEPTDGDTREGRFIPGRHLRLDDGEEICLVPGVPEPTDGDTREGRFIPGRRLRLDDGEEVSLIPRNPARRMPHRLRKPRKNRTPEQQFEGQKLGACRFGGRCGSRANDKPNSFLLAVFRY